MPTPAPRLTFLALALSCLTAGALVLDLARPTLTEPLREAVATVAAPAQQVLSGWDEGRISELTAERDELAAQVSRLEQQLRANEQLQELESADLTTQERSLLPARVVAFAPGSSPVGGRTVTLDRGEQDGVRADQSVVNVDGLVGRVIRVAPGSADVLLLGDAGVVVGVRFGPEGALGSVEARPDPGLPARGHGELTLTVMGDSDVGVGDEVLTLGSPDDIPYAAGIPLGTVTAVDPDRGQLDRTAVVTPHVDTDTLDLVAVVLSGADDAPEGGADS